MSVSGREPHRGHTKSLLEQMLGTTGKADGGVRVKVVRSVRQSQIPSRGFHMVLAEGDRATGVTEMSA